MSLTVKRNSPPYRESRKDLSKKIIEHRRTGKIAYYEEIRQQVPDELAELLEIRGVGPKFLRILVKRFGVTDIENLKETMGNPDISRGRRHRKEKNRADIPLDRDF